MGDHSQDTPQPNFHHTLTANEPPLPALQPPRPATTSAARSSHHLGTRLCCASAGAPSPPFHPCTLLGSATDVATLTFTAAKRDRPLLPPGMTAARGVPSGSAVAPFSYGYGKPLSILLVFIWSIFCIFLVLVLLVILVSYFLF